MIIIIYSPTPPSHISNSIHAARFKSNTRAAFEVRNSRQRFKNSSKGSSLGPSLSSCSSAQRYAFFFLWLHPVRQTVSRYNMTQTFNQRILDQLIERFLCDCIQNMYKMCKVRRVERSVCRFMRLSRVLSKTSLTASCLSKTPSTSTNKSIRKNLRISLFNGKFWSAQNLLGRLKSRNDMSTTTLSEAIGHLFRRGVW